MSKFLYMQDGHCKGVNSINRTGDYFSDWLKKFDELLSIAKKNKVEAILDGGDILDSPEPSYRMLDEIADRVEKVGIPIYSLFGNHAERYHSIEHSKYTGLAHLQKRSKMFQYLDSLTVEDKFVIQGFEYKHNIEEEIKSNGIKIKSDFIVGVWKIAIVHAFICPKPFPYASHVVCDDIKTNANLILVAHYHSVWEKKIGNTQYLNIGCFGRNSITEANIKPSCVLLDTDKRSVEIIQLKSAKSAEKVFNLDKIKEVKESDASIEHFVKSLESVNYQGESIANTIDNFANQNNVDKEVINLIHQKILKVKDNV